VAWTRIQTAGASNAAGAVAVATLGQATAAGTLLIVYSGNSGNVDPIVTDNLGQSYSSGVVYGNVGGGSSKRHAFRWVVTQPGVTSVTATGVTNSWVQVIEYSAGFEALYIPYEASDTGYTGTDVLTIGGALGGAVPADHLILMGVTMGGVGDGQGATTFGAGSGITTIVGTGGDANGSATLAVGENLSGADNPAANITFTVPTSDAGASAIAFVAHPVPRARQYRPQFSGTMQAGRTRPRGAAFKPTRVRLARAGATTGVTPNPLTETVTYDFAVQDVDRFTGWGAQVFLVSDQLQINATVAYPNLNTGGSQGYSLAGSSCFVEVPQVTNLGNGGTETIFFVENRAVAGNRVLMMYSGGNLVMREEVSGADDDTTLTYDSVAHRWWRIAESGDTLTWDTSPDGQTWTTRRTKTKNPALDLTDLTIYLSAGFFGTEPTPGAALFDNLNLPGTGGGALTETLTDTAGLVDTLTAQLAAARTLDDSTGLVDTITAALTAARDVTDSTGLTDTVAAGLTAVRDLTDPAGTTDTVSTSRGYGRDLTEVAGATDTVSAAASYTRDLTDTTGLTDSLTAALSKSLTLTDTAGLTDVITAALIISPVLTDSTGLVDTITAALTATRDVTDATGLTDAATAAVTAIRTIADTAGLTDTITAALGKLITVDDSTGLVDTLTTQLAAARTLDDATGLTDTITAALTATRDLTDTTGLTDTITAQLGVLLQITDTAGLTDNLTRALTYLRDVLDDSGATDTTATATGHGRPATDTAGLTDSLTAALAVARTLTDVTGLVDGVIVAVTRTRDLSDTAGLTDGIVVELITGDTYTVHTSGPPLLPQHTTGPETLGGLATGPETLGGLATGPETLGGLATGPEGQTGGLSSGV
jgi:hypothetical protein